MHTLRNPLLSILFPPFCVWCQQQGSFLCSACKKNLKPHPPCCPCCHRITAHGQTCIDCLSRGYNLDGIVIAFQYTDCIKKLVLWLKYYHKYTIATFLGEKLALLIQTNPTLMHAYREHSLIISYVPTHRWKVWMKKGYNQSKLLAEQVSSSLAVPCIPVREKSHYTVSQTKLHREQRLKNLENTFLIHKDLLNTNEKTILIIDDITTTGATLNELAKTLKKTYPQTHIRWAVVWRHGK